MAYSIKNDEAEQRAAMWQQEAEIAQAKVKELEGQLNEALKQVKNIAYEPVLGAVVGLNTEQKHELAAMWIDGIREQGMKTLETLFALDDERSKVYNKHRIEKGFTAARLLGTKHCLSLIYGG